MAPQRFDKIESAPGNGRVSAASTHKIWYTGARLPRPTPADVSRAGGTPREEGAARGSAPVVGSARASTRVVGGLGHGITSDTTSFTICAGVSVPRTTRRGRVINTSISLPENRNPC
jgi:hypothetical protein